MNRKVLSPTPTGRLEGREKALRAILDDSAESKAEKIAAIKRYRPDLYLALEKEAQDEFRRSPEFKQIVAKAGNTASMVMEAIKTRMRSAAGLRLTMKEK